MLEHRRRQARWSVGQVAWQLSVSIREYREARGRHANAELETWDRICKLYGWPQTFVK